MGSNANTGVWQPDAGTYYYARRSGGASETGLSRVATLHGTETWKNIPRAPTATGHQTRKDYHFPSRRDVDTVRRRHCRVCREGGSDSDSHDKFPRRKDTIIILIRLIISACRMHTEPRLESPRPGMSLASRAPGCKPPAALFPENQLMGAKNAGC